jgi:hypothetical protein
MGWFFGQAWIDVELLSSRQPWFDLGCSMLNRESLQLLRKSKTGAVSPWSDLILGLSVTLETCVHRQALQWSPREVQHSIQSFISMSLFERAKLFACYQPRCVWCGCESVEY